MAELLSSFGEKFSRTGQTAKGLSLPKFLEPRSRVGRPACACRSSGGEGLPGAGAETTAAPAGGFVPSSSDTDRDTQLLVEEDGL